MEKYYEKKAIRNGTVIRKCKKCKTQLSVYHNQDICSACEKKKSVEQRNDLLRMIDEIS
jgi:RNA polymerase subunit RPABC4/transcription elongation factor Spt4